MTVKLIFLLFSRSRSVREDPESQLANQFPFLPSYEMAMNEVRTSQESINSTATENTNIDDGVILEITSSSVTLPTDNQRNDLETNDFSVNTPESRNNLDDGVVLDIRNSNANTNTTLQESASSVQEQTEPSLPRLSTATNNDCTNNEVSLEIISLSATALTENLSDTLQINDSSVNSPPSSNVFGDGTALEVGSSNSSM